MSWEKKGETKLKTRSTSNCINMNYMGQKDFSYGRMNILEKRKILYYSILMFLKAMKCNI